MLVTVMIAPVVRDLHHDCPLTRQDRLPGSQAKHPTELVSEGVPHEAGLSN